MPLFVRKRIRGHHDCQLAFFHVHVLLFFLLFVPYSLLLTLFRVGMYLLRAF